MGKITLFLLFFVVLFNFSLLYPDRGVAQTCGEFCAEDGSCSDTYNCSGGVCTSASCPACTGNSGRPGSCTSAMACTPAAIDGQGSCSGTNEVCCAPVYTPPGGSLDCSDECTSSTQCLSGLSCSQGICNGPSCTACTGASGYVGSCLEGSVCAGKGKNSIDGTCLFHSPSTVCCTNAPTGENCAMSGGPFVTGATGFIDLASNKPNSLFNITNSNPSICSNTTPVTTDSSGFKYFSIQCAQNGTYTLTATSGSASCSLSVEFGPKDAIIASDNSPLGKGGCTPSELYTAIGCVPFDTSAGLVGYVLRWALGIAGGITFMLIIVAAFQISTSGGNPDRLKAGQELLTSALSGLILLVFSIFVLQVIGIQIFNLPGFRQ